jgi:signal transduction histidine kinase
LITEDAAVEYPVLQFDIRNTGSGIPADKQEKIFDGFWQADLSSTRKNGGTGLGTTVFARDMRRARRGCAGDTVD